MATVKPLRETKPKKTLTKSTLAKSSLAKKTIAKSTLAQKPSKRTLTQKPLQRRYPSRQTRQTNTVKMQNKQAKRPVAIRKTSSSTAPQHITSRRWLVALGILFLVLGSLGLSMVVGLTLMSMIVLGGFLIISGISQLMDVFKCRRWKAAFWYTLLSALYMVSGALVIYDPILASAMITMMLASLLMIIGISRLFMAISSKRVVGSGYLIFAGLVAIALGAMIMMQWPISGLWVIGLFISVQLLVDGFSYLLTALNMPKSMFKNSRRLAKSRR